jgi:four helix bundle protein
MAIDKFDIVKRLKILAVNTGKLCLSMPYNIVNKTYIGQIVRCSSSASANYRAACRGKSKADFINKLRIAEEELDETMHFYELLAEFNEDFKLELRALYKEANELLSIIIASINTTIKNMKAESEKASNSKTNLKSATCLPAGRSKI